MIVSLLLQLPILHIQEDNLGNFTGGTQILQSHK